MARVTLGTIVTNLKGSIAGTTFSNNKSGLTAKSRLVGRRNQSTKALNALQNTKLSTVAWNQLSPGNKAEWNQYADTYTLIDRYGVTKTLTGYNWYIAINGLYYYYNGSSLLVPVGYQTPDALPVFYLDLTSTDMVVTWSTPIDTGTTEILLYATAPSRKRGVYNKSQYVQLDVRGVDVSSSFSILNEWEQATGLDYSLVQSGGTFNVNVLIVAVNSTTYNTGIGVTATGSRVQVGIGFMLIGSTFIVT